jgi:hypothetical protein
MRRVNSYKAKYRHSRKKSATYNNSLFIYVLNSTANGQLQSQHEYKQQ